MVCWMRADESLSCISSTMLSGSNSEILVPSGSTEVEGASTYSHICRLSALDQRFNAS
jgi:hypothetical protein